MAVYRLKDWRNIAEEDREAIKSMSSEELSAFLRQCSFDYFLELYDSEIGGSVKEVEPDDINPSFRSSVGSGLLRFPTGI